MTGIDYRSEQATEVFEIPVSTTTYTRTAFNMTTTIAFTEEPK
ncbi:MAG: hypothetical protein ACJAUH_001391 [Saprospiraceae bacterium]|jgi:hypothetical protein